MKMILLMRSLRMNTYKKGYTKMKIIITIFTVCVLVEGVVYCQGQDYFNKFFPLVDNAINKPYLLPLNIDYIHK